MNYKEFFEDVERDIAEYEVTEKTGKELRSAEKRYEQILDTLDKILLDRYYCDEENENLDERIRATRSLIERVSTKLDSVRSELSQLYRFKVERISNQW